MGVLKNFSKIFYELKIEPKFLPQRIKNKLILEAMKRYLSLRNLSAECKLRLISINGYMLFVDISTDVGCKLYILNLYEEAETNFCVNILKPGDIAIDIGGYIGYYTILFAILSLPNGRVYSVEPIKNNIKILKRNLAINKITNVEVIEKACYDRKSVVNIVNKKDSAYSYVLAENNIEPKHNEEFFSIETVTIDSIVENFNLKKVKLLKIDAEGCEYNILSGARNSLKNRVFDFLIVEISNDHLSRFGHSSLEIFELLQDFGYTPYGLYANGSIFPLKTVSEFMMYLRSRSNVVFKS